MKKTIWGLIVIVAIILIVWVVSNGTSKQATGEPVKVGVILPLSGLATEYGEDSRLGIETALEDMKTKYPGLNLQLFYEDSFFTPKGGVDAYKKLREVNGVDIIISGAGQISSPVRPLAEQDGVLQVGVWTSTLSYSTPPHKTSYRTTLLPQDYLPTVVNYFTEKQLSKVAVLYVQNEFGISYFETFKNLLNNSDTLSLVSSDTFANDANDFRTQLAKIKVSQPDVIFYVGTAPQFVNVLKQAKELSLPAKMFSFGSIENQIVIASGGSLAEGVEYAAHFDGTQQESKGLVAKIKERYNKIPNQNTAESYLGLELIAYAVSSCEEKSLVCWKDKLDSIKDLPTVMGKANIDANGNIKVGGIYLKTIKNGQFVKMEN